MRRISHPEAAALRQKAEAQLKGKTPKTNEPLSEIDTIGLIHELEVHQIELEMQNEELMLAKEQAAIDYDKYIELYDFAPIGYFTIAREGKIIGLNLSGAKMLGKDRSQLNNRLFQTFVTDASKLRFLSFLEKVFSSSTKVTMELTLSNNDRGPMEVHLTAIADNKGKQCYVTATDITEQIQAKNELKESMERFKLLFEQAPFGYQSLDFEGHFIDVNQQWLDLLGYQREEVVGKWFGDFLTPAYREGFRERFPIFKAQGHIHSEFEMMHKNGTVLFIAFDGRIGYELNGTFKQTHCILKDITEIKIAEEALLKSQSLQHKLVSHIGDVLVIIDKNGINRYKSPNITRLFGWAPEELVGKSAWDVVHPDDLDYAQKFLGKLALEPNATGTTEIRYKCKDGRYVWIQITLVNLLSDPDIQGILGNYHDISERKLLEDTQRFLLQISNPGTDQTFFESLAHFIAHSLEMEYVCIDFLEGDGLTAQTLAIYNEGNFDPNVSYTLKDTPCGEVVGNHICCYPKDVCQLFPNDAALKEIKAESYIGTTLWSFDGKPIGLIAVIGQKPLQNHDLATALLKLVSVRAAGKLEAKLAEDKLRESEERFRVLIESTSVAIYLTDLKGKCTYVNPKWCEMAHLSPHQALNDGWINGIYEEDRVKVFENWEKMVASDGNWGCEYRFGTPDHISWVIGTAKSYKNDSGEVAGFIGSNLDITERKKIELALLRSDKELNKAQQITHIGSWYLNLGTNQVVWTEELYKMYGFDPALPPPPYTEHQKLFTPESWELLSTSLAKTAETGIPYELELRTVKKDGTNGWMWVRGETELDKEGKTVGLWGAAQDISERKRAEESLLKLNTAIEKSEVSVVITDLKGNIEYANPYFSQLTGYSPDEYIGQNPKVLKSDHHPKVFYEEMWNTINSGKTWTGEFYNRKKSGEMYWENAIISPIEDSQHVITHFVAVKTDITAAKKINSELILAKEHAEQSDHLKSAFLANMSHEIRTPMNGILGFASLLKEPNLSGEEQQDYINIIEKSGDRMLNIINDIVNISKIEAGMVEVVQEASNINEQIEFIQTFFKPMAEAKGIALTCLTALPPKESIILTDKEKVYGILTNLVKNALKFTDSGSIELGYELVAENIHETAVEKIHDHTIEKIHEFSLQKQRQQREPYLQFYVKDTGIGIAADRQGAVFERFIQADIHDVNARQGAGLGLTISKAYTEMLGGEMWLESERGKGSTFFFTLPYKRMLKDPTAASSKGPAPGASEDIDTNAMNVNILIVDDDEISAEYLATIVTSFSRKLVLVNSGREAVNTCQNDSTIDLILMDIKMADMDGYEATRQIRRFNSTVIILAQTAYALTGDKERAMEAGCNEYIEKPINRFQLIGLINKYFNKPAL